MKEVPNITEIVYKRKLLIKTYEAVIRLLQQRILMYVTTQGVKFEIIIANNEIMFKDEVGGTLSWYDNDYNRLLVRDMVHSITGVESSEGASVLSIGA